MEVQTTLRVERDDEEIELHIFGDVEPFVPGIRRGHPDNWTPDEGGCANVEGVYTDEDADESWDGKLTPEENSQAEANLIEAFDDGVRCGEEDAAEDRAEAMRDRELIDDRDYGPYGPDIYDF